MVSALVHEILSGGAFTFFSLQLIRGLNWCSHGYPKIILSLSICWGGWVFSARPMAWASTQSSTFSPLMYVSASATCQNRMLMSSWVPFRMQYNWNSHRKASLLLQFPSKIAGAFPLRPLLVAIGVGGGWLDRQGWLGKWRWWCGWLYQCHRNMEELQGVAGFWCQWVTSV